MTSRPPWWRPFARRAYDRARGNEQVVAIGAACSGDFMRDRLRSRSQRLRDRLNAETDAECQTADIDNGTPVFWMARLMRNREGEQ